MAEEAKLYMRNYGQMPKLLLGQEIHLSDSTLRDGAQMPGIAMTKKQQLGIFDYLHRVGIDKIELFMLDDFYRNITLEMLGRGYEKPEVTGWARSDRKDIDGVRLVESIKEVGILMSVSDSHIYDKMNLTREEAKRKYIDAFNYALDKGLRARCHLEDITKADMNFVLPFVEELLKRDPDVMIRVCDTVGLGLPFPEEILKYSGYSPAFGIPGIVTKLKEIGVTNIEMHTHDDYGLAVANTLAGLLYGANWASLTFLGIGERAGNSELEKVLAFVNIRAGVDRYNLECLTEFADYMEKESIIYIPRNKAVVGKNVFAVSSGIHAAAIRKAPFTYEPFSPETVGNERKFLLGPTSGLDIVLAEVNNRLTERSLKLVEDKRDTRIGKVLEAVKDQFRNGRRSDISPDELDALINKYVLV